MCRQALWRRAGRLGGARPPRARGARPGLASYEQKHIPRHLQEGKCDSPSFSLPDDPSLRRSKPHPRLALLYPFTKKGFLWLLDLSTPAISGGPNASRVCPPLPMEGSLFMTSYPLAHS